MKRRSTLGTDYVKPMTYENPCSQKLARQDDIISQPLDQNPAAVYLASLSPGSRRTMRQALDTIADLIGFADHQVVPWSALRFQHTAAIRSELAQAYAAATANKMLSALRGTLRAAKRLGHMTAEEYQAATDLGAVRGETVEAAAGRALATGELTHLLAACQADESPAGVRDAALLAVAYTCGLRRFELVGLDMQDLEGDTLMVRGKRNKTRTMPLASDTQRFLRRWLTARGPAPGALFVQIRKGGHLTMERLSAQAVYHILRRRAEEADVADFSPHDLRRTFAGDLLDAGVDLSTVQKLMGHADANTTARYDRRGLRARWAAVEKLRLGK